MDALDERVLAAIKAGNRQFYQLISALGVGYSRSRDVDKALQRLRRKGVIEHIWAGKDTGWRVRD